jgi:hypothetical protein
MRFELKSISEQGIPEALAKVERYRLLNEPALAESICLDILAVVPDQQHLVTARAHGSISLECECQAGSGRARSDQRRFRARLVRGHHLGAPGSCSNSPGCLRRKLRRISCPARGDESLRAGDQACSRWK